MMIPIHFLPFWWWYPFTSFPFDDDTHSLPSLLMMIPIHYFPFDDDTHSLLPFWGYPFTTSLLMITIFYFPFGDAHLLLHFWWYPFSTSLSMNPHLLLHLWWYPFILMTPIGIVRVRIVGNFSLSQLPKRHRVCKVEWWVLKKHSFLFITRQDKTGILVSFVFDKGFFFHVFGH
jgi:hypothetical protein